MKQVRYGVFETNSSSTHSLCIISKDDYMRWEKGEIVVNTNATKNNIKPIAEYDEDKDWNFETYEGYVDRTGNSSKEEFDAEFTASDGKVYVAFGEYGYDG